MEDNRPLLATLACMLRPAFTSFCALVLLGGLAPCRAAAQVDGAAARPQSRPAGAAPNVVLILADDLGYGDMHAFNPDSTIPTPALDSLAAQGMSFTDAHTPSAVCTPTRYGLLTGRYCWRTRLKSWVLNGYSAPLIQAGRQTLGHLFQAAGHETAIVGKWHLGLGWKHVGEKSRTGEKGQERDEGRKARQGNQIDFTKPVTDGPNAHGFDHSYIVPASLDFPPYVYVRDGKVTDPGIVQQEAQRFPAFLRKGPRAKDLVMEDVLDHLTAQAVDFIKTCAADKKPFFLYFPLTAPHMPVLPHERYRGKSGRGPYGDYVVQVDDCVRKVTETIEAAGIRDRTIVIFSSDNGSYMYRLAEDKKPDHVEDETVKGYRPAHHRANGPFRGTKADIWEAGHHVPLIVRWPGKVATGAESARLVCLTDLMATCAGLLGTSPGPGMAEDSVSFLPTLFGTASQPERPAIVHHSGAGMFAIRKGRWKLIAGNGSGGRELPKGKPFTRPFQLYDLEADVSESDDRLADEPEVARELEKLLDQIRKGGR